MKVSLSRPESKKIKPVLNSKKNSHTNSLIYKEINAQMQQLFSKSKFLNTQNKDKKDQKIQKVSKKNSYINMKKKSQKINCSESQDNSKLIINKLTNNFMAGMNSPISNSDNSQNQQQNDQDLIQLKKSIGLKSSHPAVSPSLIKSSTITTQSRPHSQKITQIQTLIPTSSSNTPTGTLSKKSYTKTKIKLQTKLFTHLKLQRKLFCYDYIIGKGGFGKVWKVEHIKTRNQYAMKEMLKSIVITKKSVQSVMNERVLLSQLNSPFLVNMHYAFQDRDTLYLVLDLMQGGDLRYHIGNRNFSEIQSKFFIACIILGLQHMHRCNIIHRDIKPENLVLDSRGYIRITDLGIARTYRHNNSSDTSGTPGYMSPQVICRQNHSFVSDFFALGVIAFELMLGKRPYNGRTRNQIRQNMLAKQAQVKLNDIPQDWSVQAADFINKLLQRKPQSRLGFNGIEHIKNHPWIQGINWQKLYTKQIQSPFIPLMKKKNFDQDEQITIEDEQQAAMIEKNSLLLRKPEFQQLFKDYYYDENENLQTAKQTKKSSQHPCSNPNKQVPLTQNKQSKKKITMQKDKSTTQTGKIGGKKYSQQLYMKKSINTTTIQPQDKDSTIRYKKTMNDITDLDYNNEKYNNYKQDVMIKDVEYGQSQNQSGIFVGQGKDRRKNSTGNTIKQSSKTFFKEFKH